MSIWIAIISAVALAGFGFAFRSAKTKKSLSVLEERAVLNYDEIYQQFYASSGVDKNSMIEVWQEIAQVLKVPAERLRPTDKFGKDIGAYWITSEALDTLGELAQQRARRLGIAIDLESILTVDDYVKKLSTRNG